MISTADGCEIQGVAAVNLRETPARLDLVTMTATRIGVFSINLSKLLLRKQQ
jgi:hypothetical protein